MSTIGWIVLLVLGFLVGAAAIAFKAGSDLDYCIRQTMRNRANAAYEQERRHKELMEKISKLERR